ncbi:ankyrin repeat domain-containing protein [Wolbachia endosymbiont (group A) of Philonthus cognatus]|uniref:ankyrin repeat domain-containing protein n=1 Tax=Wolbachia endosymbiont (group A) of Philonthus cognatus TaxID=2954046 RepID=UPI002231B185|nr:ankyrin repeat domain-containing protein [Wolbachia endosymbiont (group A) of Philonthus cognatus]
MGIIDNFLIKSVKNNDIKGVKLTLILYDALNSFRKFFSKTMSLKNTGSFDINNNQALNQALGHATDHKIMELLINRGADIHSIDENGKNVIIRVIESLAESKNLKLDSEKNLPAEIILHPTVSFLLGKGAEYYSTDDLNIEAIQQKPSRTFEYKSKNTSYDALPSKEPIYAEVYDTKVSNSLGENGYLSVSEESIYAEIYDSHKKSTENLSLEDSGYLSISEEPIYCTIDDLSEQKKPTSLKQKEPEQSSEPIYARVDLSKKRAERKAKDIKANSGTCHGLVQDKVNDWQVKLNELSANKSISQQQTNDQKIKTKAGFSVEEIRQKYERRDSGYDSGYDSDTKVEQQLELAPKSEIGSVSIEHGVIGGCRYKITDISL